MVYLHLLSASITRIDYAHRLIMLFQCLSRLALNCMLSFNKICLRTITTRSLAGKRCWFFRKLSLKILFKPFLWTAFLICFFAIAKPILGFVPVWALTRIVMPASPMRIFLLKTCRKSTAVVSLSCLGNDSSALSSTTKVSDELCLSLYEL
jgi:hypothetical protein